MILPMNPGETYEKMVLPVLSPDPNTNAAWLTAWFNIRRYELQPKFRLMESSIRDIFFFGHWAGVWKTIIHSSKSDNMCLYYLILIYENLKHDNTLFKHRWLGAIYQILTVAHSRRKLSSWFPCGKMIYRWSSWHDIHGQFQRKLDLEEPWDFAWVLLSFWSFVSALTCLDLSPAFTADILGCVLNRLDAPGQGDLRQGDLLLRRQPRTWSGGPAGRWTVGPMDPGPGDSQPWRKGCEINHPYGWFIMVYVDGIALPTFF